MRLIGWRIYYDDGTIFSSVNGGWKEARPDGVEVVVVFYAETYRCWYPTPGEWRIENYRDVLTGEDYYFLEGGVPRCGAAEISSARADPDTVKSGTLIDEAAYHAMYGQANLDRVW